MDDNPEIRDRLNVNKSTYHNKRPRERFICFIRGAKWMKINQLNGPSPIHDTSTWLSQSIQSIIHVCYWLDMQKISLESASGQLSAITICCQQASFTHAQTLPLAVTGSSSSVRTWRIQFLARSGTKSLKSACSSFRLFTKSSQCLDSLSFCKIPLTVGTLWWWKLTERMKCSRV